MSDQPTLFPTPQEEATATYNERLAAWMDARRVAAGWQCPDCGGVSRSETRFWCDHGLMGTRCMRARLRTNQAINDLRRGSLGGWREATADLRRIAAWRAQRRAS